MKTIRVKGKNYQKDYPVESEMDVRAASLDVELHNRDFPDDPWVKGDLPEGETGEP